MAKKSASKIAIAGTEKAPLAGAKRGTKADPNERIQVSVVLYPRNREDSSAAIMAEAKKLPSRRKYITREELAKTEGADPKDVDKVEAFAHTFGLTVDRVSIPERKIWLSGKSGDMSNAFNVQLYNYKSKTVSYRGRTGPIHVPGDLKNVIFNVRGLDNRPVAQPHFRLRSKGSGARPRNAPDGSLPVPAVASFYNFPSGTGKGQTIALIELNTARDPNFPQKNIGTGFSTSDLNAYFKSIGKPTPVVTAVGIDGGANLPGINPDADVEVALDIEVVGAVAPNAEIVVYFAPNTNQGFLDAISAAVHDTIRKPSIISISWGGPEISWTAKTRKAFDQLFQSAAKLGVTIAIAAGDDGSSDGVTDGHAHVDFPASSAFALAAGGTELHGSGTAIQQEIAWNNSSAGEGATGGGISDVFPAPSYQTSVSLPKSLGKKSIKGRGVPDIAGNASPVTGYQILVGSKPQTVGGTSAVAPLWAGLIALCNEVLPQPVGFLNPILYALPPTQTALRDITQGDNDPGGIGGYSAGKGWDANTGLGAPNGKAILAALQGKKTP